MRFPFERTKVVKNGRIAAVEPRWRTHMFFRFFDEKEASLSRGSVLNVQGTNRAKRNARCIMPAVSALSLSGRVSLILVSLVER